MYISIYIPDDVRTAVAMYDQLNDELGWLTNPRSLWEGNTTVHLNGAPRGFGDLGRMAIYVQGSGEHW